MRSWMQWGRLLCQEVKIIKIASYTLSECQTHFKMVIVPSIVCTAEVATSSDDDKLLELDKFQVWRMECDIKEPLEKPGSTPPTPV